MNKGIVVLLLGVAAVVGVIVVVKSKAAPKTKVLVTAAFASISGKLVQAWVNRPSGSDNWFVYDPTDIPGSDLTYVMAGETISLQVTQACTLTYGGNSYNLLPSLWNQIVWEA